MTLTEYPYLQRAQAYVEGVLDGTIPAGELIILACQRHVDDLGRIGDAEWPYTFDPAKAEKMCRFSTRFHHVKGKWGTKKMHFDPEGWQCFWYCSLFGWVSKKTGNRRFRKGRLYVPRKNGKSLCVAPIGLYMLTADGEAGPEVYSGATNEKQAWEVFGPAKQMAKMRPDFCERFGVQINAKSLTIQDTMAKFEPVIGQPGDGASPHCSITDEYHEHVTDAQLATMETGMGAREQPLSIVVSTAGDNLSGPCRDDWLECERMLRRQTQDDALFALIYTVDKDDDWTSEYALRKANPNFGISINVEQLLANQIVAINQARKQNHFKTKHLNIWVQARDAYFNMERYRAGKKPRTVEELKGLKCYMALDLASKNDLAVIELVFELGQGRLYRMGKYYLPRETVDAPENEHYRAWEIQGLLTVTDGNITDYFQILEDIKAFCKLFNVVDIAYDPYNATMLVTAMVDEGLPVTEYGANVKNFSEPMKHVEAMIRDEKLEHDGDAVAEWCMSNVQAKIDAKDCVYPRKERQENKIDQAVALIMCVGRYLVGAEAEDDWSGFIKSPVIR